MYIIAAGRVQKILTSIAISLDGLVILHLTNVVCMLERIFDDSFSLAAILHHALFTCFLFLLFF